MASVRVNMRLCDKTHRITVTPNGDGTFKVHIASDCDHVRQYAERIPTITMDDITDGKDSAVTSYDNTMMMTPTCLAPKGVLHAAWMEAGLISPTRAKEAKENSISFLVD